MVTIKLVHVTSSLRMGGAEKVLYMLVKKLAEQDFEQSVLYFHDGPYIDKINKLGIKTIHITGGLWQYDPLFFMRFYKTIKQEQPTVIHALLWAANVSARLCAWFLSIPIVCVYHNNVDQDGMLRSLCDQLTVRCSDKLVAVSDQVADSMKQRSWLPADRITIIPNGIDTDYLKQTHMMHKLEIGLPADSFVIGAVGRFVSVKRFDYLVSVYAHIKHIEQSYLVLIGSGPAEQQLCMLAQTVAEDRILFITNELAIPYYGVFDCFVQPSIKEGISLALLEAMYFKRPCIVMGDDDAHPIIEHGHNGLVIDPHNEQALIDAIHKLYTDRHYSLMLGLHAQQTVKDHFALPRMIQKYKKLFKQLGAQ